MISFHFNNEQPIYLQIASQLELAIITSELSPGERLPPVRDFATIAQVNPNTMQRALAELEGTGLIYTERTSGRYVTTDREHIRRSREQLARSKIASFLADIDRLQLSRHDIIKLIKQIGGIHD